MNLPSSSITISSSLLTAFPEHPYRTAASGTFALACRSSAAISRGDFSVFKSSNLISFGSINSRLVTLIYFTQCCFPVWRIYAIALLIVLKVLLHQTQLCSLIVLTCTLRQCSANLACLLNRCPQAWTGHIKTNIASLEHKNNHTHMFKQDTM